jgi:DtxR family manganese transport transcriptional regulator
VNEFQRTRTDHARERAEDYVEMVKSLLESGGRARVTDLARELHVRSATVTQMIRRLAEEGYVEWQPYRSITLTPKGESLAQASQDRHQVVHDFLLSLGVTPEAARHDSEGMEHHVSDETLRAMARHLKAAREAALPGGAP